MIKLKNLSVHFILVFALLSTIIYCSITPRELLSIRLDHQTLGKSEDPRTLEITHNLQTSKQLLKQCKVLGSISQLNTVQDPALQFHFKYGLNKNQNKLILQIYIDPSKTLSDDFYIILDFYIGEFSDTYFRTTINMTQYQQHIMHPSDRDHQLIFFLNGFSNIALSGNITHAYVQTNQMYVIHYMSDVGQEQFMGWNSQKDYVMFTLVVVPTQFLVQKFHIKSSWFQVNNPVDYRYFYGIKSVEDDRFAGKFQQIYNKVRFNAYKNPNPKNKYGLVLMPFYSDKNSEYVDNRLSLHEKEEDDITMILGAVFGASVLFGCLALLFFYKIRKMSSFEQNYRLNEDSQIYSTNQQKKIHKNHIIISEQSDNRGPAQDQNLKMNTVEEVDPEYEESLRGTSKVQPQNHDQHETLDEKAEPIKQNMSEDDQSMSSENSQDK